MGVLLLACQPPVEKEDHIHSIVFDPTAPGVFSIGTHYVLQHYQGTTMKPVGPGGNDYMGLIQASDGVLYSSGHSPTVRNVGIRKSTDGGNSWTTLAYEGLDFHDMAVSYANSEIIYAWSTPPEPFLTVSEDGGKTWIEKGDTLKKDLYALAADHQNADILYAGTLFGLFISQDAGQTWEMVPSVKNIPILAIADDPTEERILYLSTPTTILRTTDDGLTWEEMREGLPPGKSGTLALLAVDPFRSKEILGATAHGEVYRFNGSVWEKTGIEVN